MHLEHLSKLISQAVEMIPDSDFERVRMAKAGEGTPATSKLIRGIILEKRLALERMPPLPAGLKGCSLILSFGNGTICSFE